MKPFVWGPTALVTAALMDLWAMLLHELVWHRWLWSIHQSHHVVRRGRFEVNDLLSLAPRADRGRVDRARV